MNFMTVHILGIIIPTNFYFFRGVGIPPTSINCIHLIDPYFVGQYHLIEGLFSSTGLERARQPDPG